MAKRKQVKPVRDGTDAEVVESFRQWREANGLPFDPNLIPKRFDNLVDLELSYFDAERAVAESTKVPLPAPVAQRRAPAFVTKAQLAKEIEGTCEAVGKFVAEEIEGLLAPLRKRVEQLEATSLKDCGVWKEGKGYQLGDCVTDRGSMWVARAVPSPDRPGTSDAWRLLFKTQQRRDAKP